MWFSKSLTHLLLLPRETQQPALHRKVPSRMCKSSACLCDISLCFIPRTYGRNHPLCFAEATLGNFTIWVVLIRDLCSIWWETEQLLKWATLTKQHSWHLCCAYLCATMAHYSSLCFIQLQAILCPPCWDWWFLLSITPVLHSAHVLSPTLIQFWKSFQIYSTFYPLF